VRTTGHRRPPERLHRCRPPPFPLDVLAGCPTRGTSEAELFDATGAVHAAVAFDRDGRRCWHARTSAATTPVDKVVGRFLLDDACRPRRLGLYVSGRASFEIVQKAWAAGLAP
jgi:FdhD protein